MEENVLAYEPQPVDKSAKEKKKNKTKKVIATTTYFIALLCLLAGLFAPLFQFDKSNLSESMMFRYLPSMFNGIFGKEIIPLGSYFLPFMPTFEGKFNFAALIGLLYAVVCVFALVMLIPILLGSKKKNSSARCALGVEVLAMLVTLTYIASVVYNIVEGGVLAWSDYNFLLAFGGSLLMAIIQTVSSKGSIGVSKVIGLVLSVIGVIAILDITLFIPKLGEPLTNLSDKVKGGFAPSFFSLFELPTLGITGINMLIDFKGTIANFKNFSEGKMGSDELSLDIGKTNGIILIVIYVLLILVALFTIINLVFDVIGLSTGKKYKKDRSPCKNGLSNTFALVRYILTLLFAAAIIIISYAVQDLGLHVGIYLWLLVIVLFISMINAAIRTAVDNARYKKGTVAPSEEAQQKMVLTDPAFATERLPVVEEFEEESEPEYERLPVVEEFEEPVQETEPAYEPAYEQRLPVVDKTPAYAEPYVEPETVEPEVVEATPVVEPLSAPLEVPEEPTPTVYIYGGATDEFMETLTDNEKVEFVELFLKKSKGKVNGVPDYKIDGDNSEFFPAVFVHINRYRNIVSDALMTKMYKQLGR